MTLTTTTAPKPKRVKKVIKHKDLIGRTIALGDTVAYAEKKYQYVGVVHRMTDKMVHVCGVPKKYNWQGEPALVKRYPSDVVKIDGMHVTAYLIKHSEG
jgi:hypothetical protein